LKRHREPQGFESSGEASTDVFAVPFVKVVGAEISEDGVGLLPAALCGDNPAGLGGDVTAALDRAAA
jgi:hypothetical protein